MTERSFKLHDLSRVAVPAARLITNRGSRDPNSLAARLAQQFLALNRGLLRNLGVSAWIDYDGAEVRIVFESGIVVGAVPLLSPTSNQPDYGLVISPRFGWPGVGNILAQTGWKVVPSLLGDLPMLPNSDRNIPPWVLAGTVLLRLDALLRNLHRKFILTEKDLTAPRGQVRWDRYAQIGLPLMKALEVPCRVPDLEEHRELKAAIHFTLRKQLASLETQLQAGIVVARLIEFCNELMGQVKMIHPKIPSLLQLRSWSRTRLNRNVFHKGLDAIQWTLEDRGLAGLADLRGLPWMMSMDAFYESWVETILEFWTRKSGGILKVGRKRETLTPIRWDKPFLGSQKFLLPDFVIEHPSGQIVVDAKYKEHWEDLQVSSWHELADQIRDGHRHDLLQVLAYSALFSKPTITACLIYPCRESTWKSLKERDRLSHHASIQAGTRTIDLFLATLPMSGSPNELLDALGQDFLQPRRD